MLTESPLDKLNNKPDKKVARQIHRLRHDESAKKKYQRKVEVSREDLARLIHNLDGSDKEELKSMIKSRESDLVSKYSDSPIPAEILQLESHWIMITFLQEEFDIGNPEEALNRVGTQIIRGQCPVCGHGELWNDSTQRGCNSENCDWTVPNKEYESGDRVIRDASTNRELHERLEQSGLLDHTEE